MSALGPRPQKNRQKIARNSPTESYPSAMGPAPSSKIRSWAPCSKLPMGMKFSSNFLRGSSAHRRIVQWDFLCTNHTPPKKTSPQISVAAAMLAATTAAIAAAARFCGRSDHGTLRWGGSRDGQISVCSVSRSPPRHSRNHGAAHGPRQPILFFPHELLGRCTGFLSSFRFIVWGSVRLWGIRDVSFVGPCVFPPSCFSLLFGFRRSPATLFLARSLSLSLYISLSAAQVQGNPKLRLSFGFPCVSSWPRSSAPTSSTPQSSSRLQPPPPFLPPPCVLPWLGVRSLFVWFLGGGGAPWVAPLCFPPPSSPFPRAWVREVDKTSTPLLTTVIMFGFWVWWSRVVCLFVVSFFYVRVGFLGRSDPEKVLPSNFVGGYRILSCLQHTMLSVFLLGRFCVARVTVFERTRLLSLCPGNFRERALGLGRFWPFGLLWCCFTYVFGLLVFLVPKRCLNIFLIVRSCFSDRSLRLRFFRRRCLRFLSASAFLSFFSLSPLFKKERSGSNKPHAHLPLAHFCFFVVFCQLPVPRFLFWSRPFRRASFLFLRFVRGVFCPRAFLELFRNSFRWARSGLWSSFLGAGRRGIWVFSFLYFFVFPCVWCLRFHTFSRWTGGDLTDPAGDLAHRLGGVTPGENPILGAGLDTGICQRLFLVAGVWLGRQEPRAVSAHRRSFICFFFFVCPSLLEAAALNFTPHIFPKPSLSRCSASCVSLSLSLSLSFFFSLSLSLAWPRKTGATCFGVCLYVVTGWWGEMLSFFLADFFGGIPPELALQKTGSIRKSSFSWAFIVFLVCHLCVLLLFCCNVCYMSIAYS